MKDWVESKEGLAQYLKTFKYHQLGFYFCPVKILISRTEYLVCAFADGRVVLEAIKDPITLVLLDAQSPGCSS